MRLRMIVTFFILLVLLAAPAPAVADEREYAFARLMMKRLRDAGLERPIRYEPETFALIVGEDDEAQTIFLRNAFDEYGAAASAEEREGIVARFVRIFSSKPIDLPDELGAARERIVPMIRPRLYLASVGKDETFATRPFGEVFLLLLAYDTETTMQPLRAADLEGWKLTFDEALAIGIENLKKRGAGGGSFQEVAPGLFGSPWRDGYDASRVLLPEVLGELELKGDPVVLLPNRDVLLVTGADDATGLARMAQLGELILSEPRPLSGIALRLSEGGFRPFLPEKGHEARAALAAMHYRALAQDHVEQKRVIDARLKSGGVEGYAAPFNVARRRDTGEVMSYCVWPKGVEGVLLPKVDRVIFIDVEKPEAEQIVGDAPWERVAEVLEDLMKAQDESPPRWRVEGFPSAEQLEAIGKP